MKTVGLTGGIGAGKSWVAEIFKTLGIPVYDSDTRAKELYSESKELKEQMIAHFGSRVYEGDFINRKYLSQIVFNNPSELKVLNSFVHPLLQKDFEYWINRQNAPYVIREAAILIESGSHKNCDEIIHVTAPMNIRISRVIKRDSVSAAAVESRISNQLSDFERNKIATFSVNNNGEDSVIEQVLSIHQNLLQ